MLISDLIQLIHASPITKSFFHFTDGRNIAAIRQNGLLSMRELRNIDLTTVTGGNQWSLEADLARDLDQYVHLCMRESHPMEYRARQEGQIANVQWLKIDPAVLNLPGVMMTTVVSNQAGSVLRTPGATIPDLDLEVLYKHTDWRSEPIKERLKIVSKYEILVPNRIPLQYITF